MIATNACSERAQPRGRTCAGHVPRGGDRGARGALMKRVLSASALATAALVAAPSRAEPSPSEARADVLFNTAKGLQAGGQLADACPLFAESLRLAPGVGVALHLADCYERLGRTASAWQAFSEAEKMAHERGDEKRGALAQARARALEVRLERLTVATMPGPHEGWQISIDGAPLPPDHWNVAMAMDPGDHSITVSAPGRAPRTLQAHLDPATNAATVYVDEGGPPPTSNVPAPATAPSSPAPSDVRPAQASASSGNNTGRVLGEVGLVGVAAAGLGFGSFFMIRRAHFIQEGGPPADPGLTNEATTAATISFVASGVALTSAFVLFFTTPSPTSQAGWVVGPTPLVGGAGAFVRATF
jgi:hypothetical protein